MRSHTRSRKAQYIDRKERQLKSRQERARAKRLSRMAIALEVRADPDNNNLSTRERMKSGKQPQLRRQTLTLLPPLLVIRETQEEEVPNSNKDSKDTRVDLEERKEKRRKSLSSLHPIMSTLLATGGDQRRPRSM